MGIDHEWARIFTNGEGGMGRGVLFAGREVLVVEGPVPWTVSFLCGLASLASLARVDFPGRKGFAQRTQRTQRLGKAIVDLFLDHTRKIETSAKGRSSWLTKSEVPV